MVYTITLSIKDEKARTSKVSFHAPDSWTHAQAVTLAADIAAKIEPLITGAITGLSLSYNLPVAAYRSTPLVGADTEEKLTWTYQTETLPSGRTNSLRFSIPTIADSMVVPLMGKQARIADFLQDEVQDFHTLIVNAANSGYPSRLTDSRGEYYINQLKRTRATWKPRK